jgi:hypothetical protein
MLTRVELFIYHPYHNWKQYFKFYRMNNHHVDIYICMVFIITHTKHHNDKVNKNNYFLNNNHYLYE